MDPIEPSFLSILTGERTTGIRILNNVIVRRSVYVVFYAMVITFYIVFRSNLEKSEFEAFAHCSYRDLTT